MKISDLVQDIVREAESKFGISNHPQDTIGVWMYPAESNFGDPEWQVGLERPTKRCLDYGVAEFGTVKLGEVRFGLSTKGSTLLEALNNLLDLVYEAGYFDFISE